MFSVIYSLHNIELCWKVQPNHAQWSDLGVKYLIFGVSCMYIYIYLYIYAHVYAVNIAPIHRVCKTGEVPCPLYTCVWVGCRWFGGYWWNLGWVTPLWSCVRVQWVVPTAHPSRYMHVMEWAGPPPPTRQGWSLPGSRDCHVRVSWIMSITGVGKGWLLRFMMKPCGKPINILYDHMSSVMSFDEWVGLQPSSW